MMTLTRQNENKWAFGDEMLRKIRFVDTYTSDEKLIYLRNHQVTWETLSPISLEGPITQGTQGCRVTHLPCSLAMKGLGYFLKHN